MSLKIARSTILSLLLTILLFSNAAVASSYQYIRLGEKADSTASSVAGTAMMGGGKDLDEAFRWLCKKANGGDFLVLRSLQLRGEFFNILNHPNFADPDHDLSDGPTLGLAQFTPDIFASNPVIGSGGSRHVQVGAKIIW